MGGRSENWCEVKRKAHIVRMRVKEKDREMRLELKILEEIRMKID